MEIIQRYHFLASLPKETELSGVIAALPPISARLKALILAEKLETVGLFYADEKLYLYYEELVEQTAASQISASAVTPAELLAEVTPFLATPWEQMKLVYYSATPQNVADWRRNQQPDARCGRIAYLKPAKAASYLVHHRALVAEGLLKGDKYQAIAFKDNILFSYYETPRDREVVNVKRVSQDQSQEIAKWLAVDPESHFMRDGRTNGKNFGPLTSLLTLGR